MKSRLATNPMELNKMYTEIFKEVEEEDRADVLQFWRCVVFAARPLKLTEFNHLFAFSADPPPASLGDWLTSGGSDWTDGDRLTRLNYSQALLEALFNMIDWGQVINFHADLEVDAEALESGLDSLWRVFLDAGYDMVPPGRDRWQ
ncbi:Protein SERAC1 [Fusarium austroafricanum]|uniref:Protein SERAC1 n=1 Tax=Fusarium austroafricanum TaxID=2364996 RepID=A0A8H4KNU6_9HYPO|nr:Protein SERAC1 [Fusarium austroafricanum]